MSRPREHGCPRCCGYLAGVDALLAAPATAHRIELRGAIERLLEEYQRQHPDITPQEIAGAVLDVAVVSEERAAMALAVRS
ncbi:MAG: hypothetical protein ACHQCG_01430 [Solirubrobacterales bacterium]